MRIQRFFGYQEIKGIVAAAAAVALGIDRKGSLNQSWWWWWWWGRRRGGVWWWWAVVVRERNMLVFAILLSVCALQM